MNLPRAAGRAPASSSRRIGAGSEIIRESERAVAVVALAGIMTFVENARGASFALSVTGDRMPRRRGREASTPNELRGGRLHQRNMYETRTSRSDLVSLSNGRLNSTGGGIKCRLEEAGD